MRDEITQQRLDTDPIYFLKHLAERLRFVPGTYEVDDGDIDRLYEIASKLEEDE